MRGEDTPPSWIQFAESGSWQCKVVVVVDLKVTSVYVLEVLM